VDSEAREEAVVNEPADGAEGQAEILAIGELGHLVRERREINRLSVRQAARDADVSFATLARVEDGNQPDFVTFMKLCAWLGRPPSSFFRSVAERPTDHLDNALGHLTADPRLSPDAADRIASVVRDLYAALAQPAEQVSVMDMHLRAAPVMRPGVPERLVGILTDMRQALANRIAEGDL
jgi:transcriptional regulator with XRE-family HTH domain